jgi:H+-transporting ATPase
LSPSTSSAASAAPADGGGLGAAEARARLDRDGPNAVPEVRERALARLLRAFWAPVPWLLEAACLLELWLGKEAEAAVIGVLLAVNAALGMAEEGRARATLAALAARLARVAAVRRDGRWQVVPARELVAGDRVQLALGGIVAADVRLVSGAVLLDAAVLTGESQPVELVPPAQAWAGATVRRGEAVAEVTATGPRTRFGATARLVAAAPAIDPAQATVMRVVRNLAVINGAIALGMLGYAHHLGFTPAGLVPLGLTALLASIPVALPLTFTLAAALGARALAAHGVLPTRLASVNAIGTMDVLCVDKTGTLTDSALAVAALHALPGHDEPHLLALAALASSAAGLDAVDAAIRAAAALRPVADAPARGKFLPFDPATQLASMTLVGADGTRTRIVKGAPRAVAALVPPCDAAAGIARALEQRGLRVLAVATGPEAAPQLAGFVALGDAPRADAAGLVAELSRQGIRVIMVTGDTAATAMSVARAVGLAGALSPPGPLPSGLRPDRYAVYAGALPATKYQLVQAFQAAGYTVGMCGDGVNDAPALRAAEIGIAVASATDVARAAAGMVLTGAGLGAIVAAVREGRIAFQRLLTYTLNSLTKKVAQVLFLATGLVLTHALVLTPLLMVIIMLGGDLLGMSMTTDRVTPSPRPNHWRVDRLTVAGVLMGLVELGYCTAMLAVGLWWLRYPLATLRTLAFVALVFGHQATTYCNRTRGPLWASRPGSWVLVASTTDVALATTLARAGIGMAPLPWSVIALALAGAAACALLADLAKVPALRRLRVS